MTPDNYITFFVSGKPQTAGSKRVFLNRKTGRPIVTDDNKRSKDWRAAVTQAASQVIDKPMSGPLEVTFEFCLPRPQGHRGAKGNLVPSAPAWPTTRPDVLKLARCAEDSLSGVSFLDDAQIVRETLIKRYDDRIGVRITIRSLEAKVRIEERHAAYQRSLLEAAHYA